MHEQNYPMFDIKFSHRKFDAEFMIPGFFQILSDNTDSVQTLKYRCQERHAFRFEEFTFRHVSNIVLTGRIVQ